MRKILCCLLFLSLLLSGCQLSGDLIKEPVTFYYVRADYQKDLSGIFVSEQREASGHLEDLSYLIALYLMGPVDESLRSPIPAGTRIYVEENNTYNVKLKLSDTEKTMTDAEFSLASACLSLTCLELTGTEKVTVISGNRSVTMTPDNLELSDISVHNSTEVTP